MLRDLVAKLYDKGGVKSERSCIPRRLSSLPLARPAMPADPQSLLYGGTYAEAID